MGNHINTVGPYLDPYLDLLDWHLGCLGDNFCQQTVMAWVEVLHQYERHSQVTWQGLKKLGVRFQTASGGSDCHDWERTILSGSFWSGISFSGRARFRSPRCHERLLASGLFRPHQNVQES